MRWRIDMRPPLAHVTEALNMKAIFLDGVERGYCFRRKSLPVRYVRAKGMGEIDERGAVQDRECTLHILRRGCIGCAAGAISRKGRAHCQNCQCRRDGFQSRAHDISPSI